MPPTRVTSKAARNQPPMLEAVKEWTLATTPDRVTKVPNRVSQKVSTTSRWLHTRSVPRRSATMLEWMKAVAVSHGSRAAFSTGSQAQ